MMTMTIRPDTPLSAFPIELLNVWQQNGQACVACGRVFTLDESPPIVGTVDTSRQVVRARISCPKNTKGLR